MLAAFGVAGSPVPLRGGRGVAWRAGDVVLKPVDHVEQTEWVSSLLETLREDGFRVARPLRARDGAWIADGWHAERHVPGAHAPRWREILALSKDFHAALADVARPAHLDRRDDPWAVGDRVAWGEADAPAGTRHADRILDALRPFDLPSQVIHGDLTGNVLFADGLPPAVIDFPPYYRPPGFAAAVVVADATVWHHAPLELLEQVDPQLVLRALLYRLVTARVAGTDGWGPDPHVPVVAHALELAG